MVSPIVWELNNLLLRGEGNPSQFPAAFDNYGAATTSLVYLGTSELGNHHPHSCNVCIKKNPPPPSSTCTGADLEAWWQVVTMGLQIFLPSTTAAPYLNWCNKNCMLESKKWSLNLTQGYRDKNNTIIYIYIYIYIYIPVELIGWYCFLDQSIALTTYLIPQDCKEAQN